MRDATTADLLVRRPYRIRGASVPGYDHVSAGREGQDAWRASRNGSAVLAVADGAGSAIRSAEGATIAAGVAVAEAERNLRDRVPETHDEWVALLQRMPLETAKRLQEAAKVIGAHPRELATTLTLCVLVEDWCACVRVGDGFIAARLGQRHDSFVGYHLLLAPPPSASGQQDSGTKFLTSPDLPELIGSAANGFEGHAALAVLRDPQLTAVLVASDGLTEAAIEHTGGTHVAFPGFLAPVFDAVEDNTVQGLVNLLVEDLAATSGDDKTAVVAVRLPTH